MDPDHALLIAAIKAIAFIAYCLGQRYAYLREKLRCPRGE